MRGFFFALSFCTSCSSVISSHLPFSLVCVQCSDRGADAHRHGNRDVQNGLLNAHRSVSELTATLPPHQSVWQNNRLLNLDGKTLDRCLWPLLSDDTDAVSFVSLLDTSRAPETCWHSAAYISQPNGCCCFLLLF